MIEVSSSCIFNNTDFKERLKDYIPQVAVDLLRNDKIPTFRNVYREFKKQTAVDMDLDTFAEIYRSSVPAELRFTTDEGIDRILNKGTKKALDELTNGMVDRIDGIGETSTNRAAINKAAGILKTIEGKNNGKREKTFQKIIKDAVMASIQRLANSNPQYREMKQRDPKLTYEETLEKVLAISTMGAAQTTADGINTIQDVMEQARDEVLKNLQDLTDEDGDPVLSEEALNFFDQYRNAVFSAVMSTQDANTIIRGAILDAGYAKGEGERKTVDWKKLAGNVTSVSALRENVIEALMDGRGLSEDAANAIADSLAAEFTELVKGQKAMNIRYAIAETEAANIMERLGFKPSARLENEVNEALRNAIDEKVDSEEDLDISKIVHDVLRDVAEVPERQLANIPKKLKIKRHTIDKVSEIVSEISGDFGDQDARLLAELYGTFGKEIDDATISELQKLAELRDAIDGVEIVVDPATGRKAISKQGIEKAKIIQEISDRMARIVAKSHDYSDQSRFSKILTGILNFFSKYLPANASLVLLNPFNLTQNISSGAFAQVHGKLGGAITRALGNTGTKFKYKGDDGTVTDLRKLFNFAGKLDTYWNTLLGDQGADIPDMFTGDPTKDVKTIRNAETVGDWVEALYSAAPRAALTATDAMLKEPYFREELLRGVLYYLQQGPQAMTEQEAQKVIYEALTGNTVENLMRQAKQLAEKVGRGNDKFFVKKIAEDIQLSSLILHDEDGRPILSEENLQAIIDAAKQTSSEVYGHRIQKDVLAVNWLYDLVTGAKAKAAEGLNKDFGEKMKDLYLRGQHLDAAWLHFTHTLKSSIAFLFQRGIYNWAILMSQKNPVATITGFKALAREAQFLNQKDTQKSVENYLRSRAKIGRSILGTASALATFAAVKEMLNQKCDGDEECQRKYLALIKKDPFFGRLYKNAVSPLAQAVTDYSVTEGNTQAVGAAFKDLFLSPIVSAGSRYYSAENTIINSVENVIKGKEGAAGAGIGRVLSVFVPGKGFLSTNESFMERMGKKSPGLIDEDGVLIFPKSKKEKDENFMDAFGY